MIFKIIHVCYFRPVLGGNQNVKVICNSYLSLHKQDTEHMCFTPLTQSEVQRKFDHNSN